MAPGTSSTRERRLRCGAYLLTHPSSVALVRRVSTGALKFLLCGVIGRRLPFVGRPYDDDANQSFDRSVANPRPMIVAVGW